MLFRNEEQAMRAKMVEPDWSSACIGLGPNLFYNSPMESCIVICNRQARPAARKGKVLFIDAVNEVTRERAQSFLKPEHQQRILTRLQGLCASARFRQGRHAGRDRRQRRQPVDSAVREAAAAATTAMAPTRCQLRSAWEQWQTDGRAFWQQMDALVETLDGLPTTEDSA